MQMACILVATKQNAVPVLNSHARHTNRQAVREGIWEPHLQNQPLGANAVFGRDTSTSKRRKDSTVRIRQVNAFHVVFAFAMVLNWCAYSRVASHTRPCATSVPIRASHSFSHALEL